MDILVEEGDRVAQLIIDVLGQTGEDAVSVQRRRCRDAVRFARTISLTKLEAFEACEVCADAERVLLRSGRAAEAARVAALFELFERLPPSGLSHVFHRGPVLVGRKTGDGLT